jgi:hypothetical protein
LIKARFSAEKRGTFGAFRWPTALVGQDAGRTRTGGQYGERAQRVDVVDVSMLKSCSRNPKSSRYWGTGVLSKSVH